MLKHEAAKVEGKECKAPARLCVGDRRSATDQVRWCSNAQLTLDAQFDAGAKVCVSMYRRRGGGRTS